MSEVSFSYFGLGEVNYGHYEPLPQWAFLQIRCTISVPLNSNEEERGGTGRWVHTTHRYSSADFLMDFLHVSLLEFWHPQTSSAGSIAISNHCRAIFRLGELIKTFMKLTYHAMGALFFFCFCSVIFGYIHGSMDHKSNQKSPAEGELSIPNNFSRGSWAQHLILDPQRKFCFCWLPWFNQNCTQTQRFSVLETLSMHLKPWNYAPSAQNL